MYIFGPNIGRYRLKTIQYRKSPIIW